MTSLGLVERALNEQFQAEALETKPQDDDKKLSLGAQASSCKLSISRLSLVAEAFTWSF